MRCIKIEKIESDSDLYDLEIDGGGNNYVAEGIVVHNTFMGIGVLPAHDHDPKHIFGRFVLFSKGLGSQGLCFKLNEANESNVYFRAAVNSGLFDILDNIVDILDNENDEYGFDRPLFLLGEAFGGNIQDKGWYSDQVDFRLFDIASGYNEPGLQTFFNYDAMTTMADLVGIQTVPLLYRGPYSKAAIEAHTSGKETVSSTERNMREGGVIKPVKERKDPECGRVLLKSVSEEYLLRKHGTEYR